MEGQEAKTVDKGDKVIALGRLADIGVIDHLAGPEAYVDWTFERDGEQFSEYCAYYLYDLTWDETTKAWTIPPGKMGH